MLMPTVGSQVKVLVYDPFQEKMIPPGEGWNYYEGVVLEPDTWTKPDEFVMTGDDHHPRRTIKHHRILDLEVEKGTVYKVQDYSKGTWTVVGSRGDNYTVRYDGVWTCTCPGFHYHNNCRHIKSKQT